MAGKITRRDILGLTGAGAIGATFGVEPAAAAADGRGGNSSDGYIVGVKPGKADEVRDRATELKRVIDFGDIGQAVAGKFPEEALNGLERNPNVRYIEENGVMYSLGETVPYGIEITEADVAIEGGDTGDGVSIAILDTGIDPQHEVLEENLGDGWAATETECDTSEDCDPSFYCRSNTIDTCYEDWDDDNDHGTHVAGTAAAAMNDTEIMGVAPDATLHSVKVLDCCGNGSFDDIAAGIDWAADQGHEVINMSLGSTSESETVTDAVEYAAGKNVVMVAAAGNNGPCDDCVGSPAAHPEVIAVSATDENDELGDFSSTGPEVDIAAPGDDVLSSVPRDNYVEHRGTSMAAPHVAGAAASVIASGITDREDVRDQLTDTAEDIGLDDNEQGAGRLNVADAVDHDESDIEIDVQSKQATDVDETSATLNGELVEFSGTDEIEVWFEYGERGTGLSESTSLLTLTQPTTFSESIGDLRDDTEYEFRAHGATEDVEKTGGVETFTTEAVVLETLEFKIAGEADAVTIEERETVGYEATAFYSDDTTKDVTDEVAVTSTNETVVSVSEETTEVTGEDTGEDITVEAGYKGVVDSVEVTVEEPAYFAVDITGANDPVRVGETLEVTVEVENTGEAVAEQEIQLFLDGEVVGSQSVSLDGDQIDELTLTYAVERSVDTRGRQSARVESTDDADTETINVVGRPGQRPSRGRPR